MICAHRVFTVPWPPMDGKPGGYFCIDCGLTFGPERPADIPAEIPWSKMIHPAEYKYLHFTFSHGREPATRDELRAWIA